MKVKRVLKCTLFIFSRINITVLYERSDIMKTKMFLDMDTGEWVEVREYEPGEAPAYLEALFEDLEDSEFSTEYDDENFEGL